MRCRTVPGLVLAATSLAASLGGCLDAVQTVAAVYDAGADSNLVVYELISGAKDASADLPFLKAAYANRDHLILLPITFYGSPTYSLIERSLREVERRLAFGGSP